MDFKKQFENINNLGKQVEELNRMNNKAYSSLSPEAYEKVKQHQIDANTMLREFKKGNFNAVEDLITKYTK